MKTSGLDQWPPTPFTFLDGLLNTLEILWTELVRYLLRNHCSRKSWSLQLMYSTYSNGLHFQFYCGLLIYHDQAAGVKLQAG